MLKTLYRNLDDERKHHGMIYYEDGDWFAPITPVTPSYKLIHKSKFKKCEIDFMYSVLISEYIQFKDRVSISYNEHTDSVNVLILGAGWKINFNKRNIKAHHILSKEEDKSFIMPYTNYTSSAEITKMMGLDDHLILQ